MPHTLERAAAGRLPDFLVIGAAKCGTTTLCALLARHPEIHLHPRKELDFFSHDERYARGPDWYRRCFAGAGHARSVGEGSPNYSKLARHPRAAERIARDLPQARLLYIVRHPLRRMESAWLHARRSGHRSRASFVETVRAQPEYVDTSDYGRQLAAFQRFYPPEQLLVLFLDELERDPRAVLQRCAAFLGVDPALEIPGLDERRKTSEGRRLDTPLLHALKRWPAFAAWDRRAPRAWRRLRRRWLQSRLEGRPQWDAETLAWVRERLAEPTARFLSSQGRPVDTWRFDPEDPGTA